MSMRRAATWPTCAAGPLVPAATGGRMRSGKRQQGMAYLWMLGVLAVMVLLLGRAVEVDITQGDRLRERLLLQVGDEYRRAIASYVQAPGANGQYPRQLEDLLQDP